MKVIRALLLMVATAVSLSVLAAEEPFRDLDKIEAALKTTPDDPMLHYRKCQALFAKGKEQQAVDHAGVALTKFKAAQNNLAWMWLGSIQNARHRIDVHYNMGPKERAEKKDGIVRPYSFRVWTTDPEPKMVRILDFEIGYLDGEAASAAIGESSKGYHANLGTIDSRSDFATVKKEILRILGE